MSVADSVTSLREHHRRSRRTSPRSLRFVTFLAPNLLPLYEFITRYVGEQLGCATELVVGSRYEQLATDADVAFVCGLAYVELTAQAMVQVEPLAAPVLQGERYGGRPIYYSDVVVRRDSGLRSFADLRGHSWAFNEPLSQSGCGITRYHLVQMGETQGFFGRVVEAGWHERSLRLVGSGEVDAAAIDSQVLAVTLRDQPELAGLLQIIDTLGPSPIQPVVAARCLPERIKRELRRILRSLGDDPVAQPHLTRALVNRFAPVNDSTYNEIRRMRDVAETAGLRTIR